MLSARCSSIAPSPATALSVVVTTTPACPGLFAAPRISVSRRARWEIGRIRVPAPMNVERGSTAVPSGHIAVSCAWFPQWRATAIPRAVRHRELPIVQS